MKNLKTILLIAMLSCGSFYSANAQTSTKIEMDELPPSTHTLIHGKYAKYKVNSMFKKQDEQEVLTYVVELQRKTKVITLIYDAEGNLLDTEKSKEFSYDGSEKPANSAGGGGGDGHGGHSH